MLVPPRRGRLDCPEVDGPQAWGGLTVSRDRVVGALVLNAVDSWNGRLTNCAHASPKIEAIERMADAAPSKLCAMPVRDRSPANPCGDPSEIVTPNKNSTATALSAEATRGLSRNGLKVQGLGFWGFGFGVKGCRVWGFRV